MFIANITNSVILGIDWLQKQRAVIDLSHYSIRLNGQNIISVMINTAEHHGKIYRVKTRKKKYTKNKVKHPLLY
jgi:hypothetical protein